MTAKRPPVGIGCLSSMARGVEIAVAESANQALPRTVEVGFAAEVLLVGSKAQVPHRQWWVAERRTGGVVVLLRWQSRGTDALVGEQ